MVKLKPSETENNNLPFLIIASRLAHAKTYVIGLAAVLEGKIRYFDTFVDLITSRTNGVSVHKPFGALCL